MSAVRCPICSGGLQEEFAAKFCVVGKCGNRACGHLFAMTRPIGTGVHEHAESNIGLYAARNKILANKLVDIGLLTPRCGVLDIGSGLGHIMGAVRERMPDCRITCVEAAPKSIEHLRRN